MTYLNFASITNPEAQHTYAFIDLMTTLYIILQMFKHKVHTDRYLISEFVQVKTRVNLRAFKQGSALTVPLSMNGK